MLKPNSAVTTNLIRARELIADEKNWCVGSVEIGNRHCALGAVNVAASRSASSPGYWATPEWELVSQAAVEIGKIDPVTLNNKMGHAATMRMFDRAIELSLQEHSPEQPR